ncbi:OmpA family protein [Metallibacterium sp.]|uniref:OmpA family protein n=1 Tax=Metallibacterium sp. TaxID=2940281 RepID=UPI0026247E0F|nr:OmpA family protein [Metallibacterium sp.]
MKRVLLILVLCAASSLALAASPPPDPAYQHLSAELARLSRDPVLGHYAQGEQARARDVLAQLLAAAGDRTEHAYWAYIAARRVALAATTAQIDDARAKLVQLQQERERIQYQAKEREVARVRQQLAQAQLQNAAAAEETQRLQTQGQSYAVQAQQAQQQATQARQMAAMQARAASLAKREAALAEQAIQAMQSRLDHLTPRQGPQGLQMTLEGDAFAPGQSVLKPQAASHLGTLVQFAQAHAHAPLLVIGYTDDTGSAAANLVLSRQRAQAVAQTLVAHGVRASRIHVEGRGEADPIASNATPEGRARNRRVVVILRGVNG